MTWEPERRVAAAVAVLVILLGLSDPAISWFTGPAALGGVVIAALLFLGHRTHALDRLEETTDGTGHAPLGGVFNLSSVHPSGLGAEEGAGDRGGGIAVPGQHLDQGEGLGSFMELEVVLHDGQPDSEGHAIAADLMRRLGIAPDDLVVCVQGDEPMMRPDMMDAVTAPLREDPAKACTVLAMHIVDETTWLNPDTVKIIHNASGEVLAYVGSAGPASSAARSRLRPMSTILLEGRVAPHGMSLRKSSSVCRRLGSTR